MAVKFDYQDAINTAEELIDYFGMDAVLRRDGSSPEDRPCRVVLVEINPRERAGELTNPTDRKVIMSAKNEEVQLMPPDNEQDVLVTFVQKPTGGAATPLTIDKIMPFTSPAKPTAPAGIVVCYEFTVRK